MYKWFTEGNLSKAKKFLAKAEVVSKKLKRAKRITVGNWNNWRTRPIGKDVHLGIEVECFFPDTMNFEKAMRELAPFKKYLNIDDDGSIQCTGNKRSSEIKICFPVHQPYILKGILDTINKYGASVNSSCGLHVHIDMRQRTVKEVIATAQNLENVMHAFKEVLPKSRRRSSWARFTKTPVDTEYCRNPNDFSFDRYKAVNLDAYGEHRTIEIRCHSGSTNYIKIWNWCKFLLLLCSVKHLAPTKTLKGIYKQVALPVSLKNYLEKRKAELKKAA
jgi:hypothetical protein